MARLDWREIVMLIVFIVCAIIITVIGFSLTFGNLGNLKDFSLVLLGALFPTAFGALGYGFKPRLDRFFEKHTQKKPDLREHTERLCRQSMSHCSTFLLERV
jgi:membrane protease YdiL (CAAX protease family)